jgi:hypothetical protein
VPDDLRAMCTAYFDRLLELINVDAPKHIFERVERFVGLGQGDSA